MGVILPVIQDLRLLEKNKEKGEKKGLTRRGGCGIISKLR